MYIQLRLVFFAFLGTLFIFTIEKSNAQVTFFPTAGVSTIGINSIINKIEENAEQNSTAIPGFTGGIGLNFKLSDKFSIQPELLYTQTGRRFTESGITAIMVVDDMWNINFINKPYKIERTLRLNYLEVPVTAKLSFGEGKRVSYHIGAGVFTGLALGGRESGKSDMPIFPGFVDQFYYGNDWEYNQKIKFEYGTDTSEEVYYSREEINRVNFGLLFGTGMSIKTGSGVLGLDIGYRLGAVDMFDDISSKTKGFTFSAGYKIALGSTAAE